MTPPDISGRPRRQTSDHADQLSTMDSVRWPAVAGGTGSRLAAMLFQLEQTQWWDPASLRLKQFTQLGQLLEHAFRTVPFYRDRLAHAGYEPGQTLTDDFWQSLPILTRGEIQEAAEALRSTAVPAEHGRTHSAQTSGSTGQALKVYGTELNNFFWMAFTLRDHLWHRRDFRRNSASIRYHAPGSGRGAPPGGTVLKNWGAPVSTLFQSGESATLSITTPTDVQLAWLRQRNPHYLLSHPSNLEALANAAGSGDTGLSQLVELRTIGEILSPAQRELFRNRFDVPVVDIYSCNEVGYIALQCPDCGQYHVQSENALVEILDDDGRECAPGETGRVIVTGLHNFAMPLLRYELRDYATVGDPASCGRGLPAIRSIVGRRRNMFTLPSGEKRWATGFLRWSELAPISQVQFIQRSVDHVEARVVPLRALTADEEAQLTRALWEDYGYSFRVTFTYLDELQGHGRGKFEEFVSEVS